MMSGFHFGDSPIKAKAVIEEQKKLSAEHIIGFMDIEPAHVGLEIGTGCGLLTKYVAQKVKFLYGCDISESFLKVAARECSALPNTSFHHIQPGDLSFVAPASLDFIYSNNVFIHLDIFEIVEYLASAHKILKAGGGLLFDIAAVEHVDFINDRDYRASVAARKADPFIKSCVQFNSTEGVLKAASQLGFTKIYAYLGNSAYSYMHILLRKLG